LISPDPWRGRVNELLYGLLFERQLDDAVVERVARLVLTGDVLPSGAAAYDLAIRQGLAQPDDLNGQTGTPHSEAEVRTFLGQLLSRMQESRPWPDQVVN
jgi:hypothetical protein